MKSKYTAAVKKLGKIRGLGALGTNYKSNASSSYDVNCVSGRRVPSLLGDSKKSEGFLFLLELRCFCMVVGLRKEGLGVVSDNVGAWPGSLERKSLSLTPTPL